MSDSLTVLNQAAACIADKKTFVLLREPGEEPELWLQHSRHLLRSSGRASGGTYLTVRPFDGTELYLSADQVIRNGETAVLNKAESSEMSAVPQTQRSDAGYMELVGSGITAIHTSELEKVALSKLLTVETNDLDVVAAFQNACVQLPNAFIYLLRSPETGMWLGATPEKLIAFQGNKVQIDSIAATRHSNSAPLDPSAWNEKERQEQQIVTDGIIDVLQRSGCTSISAVGPEVLQAGPVSHLYSKIRASSDGIDTTELINELHPTAAVGGDPKDSAIRFIRANEGYERGLYTGFLGVSKSTVLRENYYVNIRCMQVFDGHVQLYLGCGITGSSIPQNELDETKAKARTWMDILAPATEDGDHGPL